jgi:predicted nucleotidyltransferase
MKRKSVTKEIKKMMNRIVRQFQPERVILLGSQARGEGGPDSDVDLLIVMPVEGSRRDKQRRLGRPCTMSVSLKTLLSARPRASNGARRSLEQSKDLRRWMERRSMQRNEQVIKVVREWMEKAENDLKNAGYTLLG